MEARARVLRIQDDRAMLACEGQSGCAACGAGRGCGLRWRAGQELRELGVPATRDDGALLVCGESVTVSVADGDLLRVAAWLYLPPLAGLLAGPLLVRYAAPGEEGVAALAGLGGLLAGWLLARAWAKVRPPTVFVSRAHVPGPAA